jgi:hypothetical protein
VHSRAPSLAHRAVASSWLSTGEPQLVAESVEGLPEQTCSAAVPDACAGTDHPSEAHDRGSGGGGAGTSASTAAARASTTTCAASASSSSLSANTSMATVTGAGGGGGGRGRRRAGVVAPAGVEPEDDDGGGGGGGGGKGLAGGGGAAFATHTPAAQVPQGCEWHMLPSGFGVAEVHAPSTHTPPTAQSVSGGSHTISAHGSHPLMQQAFAESKKFALYPQPPPEKQNAGEIPALHPCGNVPLQTALQLTVQSVPDQPASQSHRASNSFMGVQDPWSPQSTSAHGLLSQVAPENGASHSHAAVTTGRAPPR